MKIRGKAGEAGFSSYVEQKRLNHVFERMKSGLTRIKPWGELLLQLLRIELRISRVVVPPVVIRVHPFNP